MKIEIKSWFDGSLLFECDAESVGAAVQLAVGKSVNLHGANLYGANLYGANLDGANLSRANLSRANLYGANLDGANLYGANLDWANLYGAKLDGANLYGATLDWANLYGANLDGANLYGANLDGATLYGAKLDGANLDGSTTLSTGETLDEYIRETMPALLVAGGKTVAEVAAAWECHDWCNCPMAVAFGCTSLDGVPLLYRPRAEQFVQLFDAKLLPNPMGQAAKASCP